MFPILITNIKSVPSFLPSSLYICLGTRYLGTSLVVMCLSQPTLVRWCARASPNLPTLLPRYVTGGDSRIMNNNPIVPIWNCILFSLIIVLSCIRVILVIHYLVERMIRNQIRRLPSGRSPFLHATMELWR